MLINEAIQRADALLNNEYTAEEKYHWCDVVSAELKSVYARSYKRAKLFRWQDGMYLLPQDCEFENIEKIIYIGRELDKEDMRTHGIRAERSGSGRVHLIYPDTHSEYIEVVYIPTHRPIRRINITGAHVIIPPKDSSGHRTTLKMNETCPFLPGDTVQVTTADAAAELHVTNRTADFDDISMRMYYSLEYGEGEADELSEGEVKADMRRIVTDRTVCDAPYDEMYIDYICAQICFFQRKHDVYQQFIARYNERMKEYGKFMKENAAVNDRTVFTNWWKI